ncbi:MAG: LPS export ABC transporter periplasmic protein LptC [Aeromonas sp.]
MNKQTALFAALFVLGLVAWQLTKVALTPTVSQTEPQYQPDFVAKALVTTRFSADGLRLDNLSSAYAEYYQALDQATFTAPVLTLFDAQGAAQWRLSAANAVWNLNDNLLLREQVVLTGLAADSLLKQLTTPYLEFDLVTHSARSNRDVVLRGADFQTTGVGLRGQLHRKYFELLDQGHATYFNSQR